MQHIFVKLELHKLELLRARRLTKKEATRILKKRTLSKNIYQLKQISLRKWYYSSILEQN